MAPTTKETVLSSPPAQENSPTTQSAQPQAAPRTNAIGLEVPVVVHASRYSASTKGFTKPLPAVHEETRTVIVFEQGAVVRLTASLSIGETVVLTNQQTGADVLCRVGSVKAQPGIQNYVDLEFTQRAPGFWSKTANADVSSLRSAGPVPEVAPKMIPVIPLPAEPSQQSAPEPPAPPPPVSAEPALPSPKPAPRPAPMAQPSVATLGAQPELAPRPSPAPPTPLRPAPSVVSGASAGMRHTHTGEQAVLGGGLDWTKETPARSRKGLIAAVAVLAIGGLAGGTYFYTQRGHSQQQASEATVAASSAPGEQPTQPQVNETPVPAANRAGADNLRAEPRADADSSPVPPVPDAKSVDAPKPARHEPTTADLSKPVSAPLQSVKQTAPLRPVVQVGRLKAPVLKNAVISGSSEPPPTLSAQAATRDILGSSGLSGASGPSAPVPPVAFASPEPAGQPVKPGGQLQMPKVISSPPPAYPDLARAQGVEGTVTMDALIDATGAVADVKVTSGPMVLRQAATNALRRWKYQPAHLNGQPTSIHMNVSINFTIH